MSDFSEEFKKALNTEDSTAAFDAEDIRQSRPMSILAYLSLLVVIPLFLDKGSKYTRYHCNQGLILAIPEVVCGVVLGLLDGLPLIGWIFRLAEGVLGILFLLFSVLGIVNVVNGRAKALPVFGGLRVLK